MKDKLALAPLPKGPSTKLKAATKLQVWSLGRNSSRTQREKALVMIDFITKPWATKNLCPRRKKFAAGESKSGKNCGL